MKIEYRTAQNRSQTPAMAHVNTNTSTYTYAICIKLLNHSTVEVESLHANMSHAFELEFCLAVILYCAPHGARKSTCFERMNE